MLLVERLELVGCQLLRAEVDAGIEKACRDLTLIDIRDNHDGMGGIFLDDGGFQHATLRPGAFYMQSYASPLFPKGLGAERVTRWRSDLPLWVVVMVSVASICSLRNIAMLHLCIGGSETSSLGFPTKRMTWLRIHALVGDLDRGT